MQEKRDSSARSAPRNDKNLSFFSQTVQPVAFGLVAAQTQTRRTILRKTQDKKSVLLFRGIHLRRLTRTVQNIRVDQSNLRGGNVPGERRHAEFPPRSAQHNFLEHLV